MERREPRVVITGLGAVTAAGWGVPAFQQMLQSGRTAIGAFDRLDHADQRTHVAGQVPAPERRSSTSQRPDPRWTRFSSSDRFALFSAYEAIDQAGLTEPLHALSAGVFFGCITGGMFETEKYLESLWRPTGRRALALLASHNLSAPAETVARHLGITGPVETIAAACASGGLAIEQALRAIRSSEVEIALAGGTDCLCLLTYSGFNALRAVDEKPCRPFRADRTGLSLGEGGAVLVIETLEHALARGAQPLAEILGAGSSCDASHMTAPHAEGTGAAMAIERALDDAGLDSAAIDFVNAHATGTPANDAAEWAALLRVFGERAARIPVDATKATTGHLMGAAGVIEAIAVVLAITSREITPVPGGSPVDPAFDLDLVIDSPRALPRVRTALSTSLGFGGANSAVVFARWDA